MSSTACWAISQLSLFSFQLTVLSFLFVPNPICHLFFGSLSVCCWFLFSWDLAAWGSTASNNAEAWGITVLEDPEEHYRTCCPTPSTVPVENENILKQVISKFGISIANPANGMHKNCRSMFSFVQKAVDVLKWAGVPDFFIFAPCRVVFLHHVQPELANKQPMNNDDQKELCDDVEKGDWLVQS